MEKKLNYIGGFVSKNSGSITDCYSLTKFNGSKFQAGGFAGENSGIISFCYTDNRLKGLTGGFSASSTSKIEHCYFFHEEKAGSKKMSRLWDWMVGQRMSEIFSGDDIKELGFDTDSVWQYEENTKELNFIPEKWLHPTEITEETEGVVLISDADGLYEFARRINSGDKELAKSKVLLTADIDLGGKEWTPIGNVRTIAFSGVFDGNGHMVKNFKIKDKKTENKGFFAFLKGEVYNLTVDCVIKGTGCCGGLVAQNIGGIIGCCGAIVGVKGTGKNVTLGGLVGINSGGTVFRSYAAGKYFFFILPLWPIGAGAGGLALLYAVFFLLLPRLESTPIYQELPSDQSQVPIPGDNEVQKTGTNFISFQFEKEITVRRDQKSCTLNFKNPGSSNHDVIVQLQISDKLANEIMGGTGRDPAEQAAYEAKEGYDPANSRVVIAQSELLHPGYQIEALTLTDYAKENLTPGTYSAVIYIIPYDIKTNARAMLESQLPVTIKVR